MFLMNVVFYGIGYQMNFIFLIIYFEFDDSLDETCVNLWYSNWDMF